MRLQRGQASGVAVGCVGGRVKLAEVGLLQGSLANLRRHYAAQPADAEALLKVGDSPADRQLRDALLDGGKD